MRITFGGIEEQIQHGGARDVGALGRNVGEEDAGDDFGGGPGARKGEEVLFAEVGEAEEPEDGVREGAEDAEVEAEGDGVDLGVPLEWHIYNRVSDRERENSGTNLVELIKIPQNNRIITKSGKKLLP
jgi:hypothetical protein